MSPSRTAPRSAERLFSSPADNLNSAEELREFIRKHFAFGETQPDYIRLPKSGNAEPHSGLSRSALDLLIRPQPANDFRPPVKSKMLRMTGEKRGIVLIDYRSLRIYLDGLPAGNRA